MEEIRTYIQQIKFNGLSYTKGSVVDLLSAFNIVAQEFPFMEYPKTKELPERDWAGEHGKDVYVPDGTLPMDAYEIEVTFLYKGTVEDMRDDISNFIKYITGAAKGKSTDTVQSGRLSIYHERTGVGRKDVVVKEINNEFFYLTEYDDDGVATLKVKFKVYDPVTDVSPVRNEQTVSNLNFS